MNTLPYPKPYKGFTLIELLITISILIIIAGVTIPSFGNFSESNSVQQAALNLTTDVELVKSKALSGAAIGSTKVNWGIIVCEGGSTDDYRLTAFDIENSNEVSGDSVTNELTSGVSFDDDGNPGGGCTQNIWIFERLTGQPVSTTSNSVILERNGITRTITINSDTGNLTFN